LPVLCGQEPAVAEQVRHLVAELGVVLVCRGESGWRRADAGGADPGQARDDHLVAEDDDAGDGAGGLGRDVVAA